MTKQLRLAVGELTDVGRRRERNQDNVTHYVPDDAEVLARRGALFVVCDGMGGHAAGEIASEIAVTTIRKVYFEETRDDVVTALSRAVSSANSAIFEHAREHQTHTGMGTTCVALALVGGRGYFANVGDSRAYVVRDGILRQITLDHSWVAEQVRAGILTEQQARVHAHRNVITRSLGTQPEVVADLFIEDMHQDDHVLLCSDGLHGYVAEDDILNTIQQMEPDDSAHQLIDLANGNGGPDNITAVVVRLLEVPEISDELNLPQTIKINRDRGPITDMPTQPPLTEAAALRRGATTGVLAHAAASEAPAALAAAPVSVSRGHALPTTPARGRWPVVALRLLAVAALLLLVAGMWDVIAGPYASDRAANAQALHDIATADSVAQAASSQSPPVALATLASVQQTLKRDLTSLPLDAQGQSLVNAALDHVVAPAVRQSLQTYNELNLIANVPPSAVTTYTVSCASGTFADGLQTLAVTGSAAAPAGQTSAPVNLYALTGTGALYALTLTGGANTATCGATPLIGTNVRAIASDASQLYALVQQGTTWQVLQVGPDGKTTVKINQPVSGDVSPGALAAHGGDFYVAFDGSAPNSAGVWHFNGDLKKPQATIGVAAAVSGLTVTADGTPFALLTDGALARLNVTGQAAPVAVAVAPLVVAAAPSAYAASTPVPTVPPTSTSAATATPSATADATATTVTGVLAPDSTPTASGTPAGATPAAATPGATPTATPSPTATATPTSPPTPSAMPTLFAGASGFSADRSATGSIFIGDGASARVVRFGVSAGMPQVLRQYAYGAPLSALQSVTISPDGTQLFAWSGGHLVQVTLPN